MIICYHVSYEYMFLKEKTHNLDVPVTLHQLCDDGGNIKATVVT